jgi:hypothetical protein
MSIFLIQVERTLAKCSNSYVSGEEPAESVDSSSSAPIPMDKEAS